MILGPSKGSEKSFATLGLLVPITMTGPDKCQKWKHMHPHTLEGKMAMLFTQQHPCGPYQLSTLALLPYTLPFDGYFNEMNLVGSEFAHCNCD